jgi:hypothetical protein
VACPIGRLRPSTAARAKPLIFRKAISSAPLCEALTPEQSPTAALKRN